MSIRKRLSSLLDSTLFELLKILIVPIIAGSASFFSAFFVLQQKNPWITWPISIISALIFALLSILIYERFSSRVPRLKRVVPDFKLLRVEISMKYTGDGVLDYSKSKKIQALKQNLYFYRDKYKWTGTSSVHLDSEVPEHSIIEEKDNSVYSTYRIEFNRTLKKNEIVDVGVVCTLDNSDDKMTKFISCTIEEPTEELKLTLIAPPSAIEIHKVLFEESSHIGALHPYRTIPLTSRSDGKFTHTEKHPKLMYHYQLRWL